MQNEMRSGVLLQKKKLKVGLEKKGYGEIDLNLKC